MVDVVIERIAPTSEHDRQKFIRLRGYVPGSPEKSWLTATFDVAKYLDDADGSRFKARVDKLRADVEEYYGRWLALENEGGVEARLVELGIEAERAKAEKENPPQEKEPQDAPVSDPV